MKPAVVVPNTSTGDNDWVPANVSGEQTRVNSESITSNAEALTTLAKRIAHNKWLHGNSMKAINAIIAQMGKDEMNLNKRRMYIKDLQKAVRTLISGTKRHMERITVLEAKVPAIVCVVWARTNQPTNQNTTTSIYPVFANALVIVRCALCALWAVRAVVLH